MTPRIAPETPSETTGARDPLEQCAARAAMALCNT